MSEYVLHCFAQSGNAYKPALMLELAGAAWQPPFVGYFSGETRSPEYRAKNVIREVPILEHRGSDEEIGVDWAQYPNIAAWLARFAAVPGWKHPYDLMPGHPLPAAAR